MDTLLKDLRYAARVLWNSPAFTLVAVLSVALGIGANAVVFCWAQTVLFRPFSGAKNGDELVVLAAKQRGVLYDTVSYPDIVDFRGLKDVFAGIVGSQITPACLTIEGKTEWIYGQITTADFFDVFGVKAAAGRTFQPEEDQQPGGNAVLVLSEAFWRRRFAADPNVIGKRVDLNRHSFTVVGVAGKGFAGSMSGLQMDFWAPLSMHKEVANFGSLTSRGDRWLHSVARLADGVTLAKAQAAADRLTQHLASTYPSSNEAVSVQVLPTWKSPWGGQSLFLPVLRVLAAVSLGVLAIVTANVANLLLVRAHARQKEMAVRLAIGAGRARLIRQLLTESVMLAGIGGAIGVLFAHWASHLLMSFVPPSHLPIGYDFNIDGRVVVYTALLTAATGIVFGLAPAWRMTRPQLNDTLKDGGRRVTNASPQHRLRSALVVAEVALALLLLIGAGLCIQGFQRSRGVDPGFDPKHSVVAGLRIGMNGHTEQTGKVFYREVRRRIEELPGVNAAGLASYFPLGFEGGGSVTVEPEGYSPAAQEYMGVRYSIISPGYFEAMGIPVLAGRDFSDRDDQEAPMVVVVNETMAKRYWGTASALGRKVRIFGNRTMEVVGIAKAGKYKSLSEPAGPFFYIPFQQGVWDLNLGLVVRSEGDPSRLIPAIKQAIREVDPGVEVYAALAMSDYVEAAYLAQRVAATLLVALGTVALALAAMGIYGVMAFVVNQRTHEIGVRLALGAQHHEVRRLILRQGMRLALMGVGCGLAGALLATRFLAAFLYGVSPFDLLTFSAVTLVLVGIAFAATYVPARRATQVDPMIALRCD